MADYNYWTEAVKRAETPHLEPGRRRHIDKLQGYREVLNHTVRQFQQFHLHIQQEVVVLS